MLCCRVLTVCGATNNDFKCPLPPTLTLPHVDGLHIQLQGRIASLRNKDFKAQVAEYLRKGKETAAVVHLQSRFRPKPAQRVRVL